MITRLIWTIWAPIFSVPQKADKLNISLSLSISLLHRSDKPGVVMHLMMKCFGNHYTDVTMSAMTQITSVLIAQRKHQSSASLAFAWGIHRWPVSFPRKRPVTGKMLPFDDVIAISCLYRLLNGIIRFAKVNTLASHGRYGVSSHWQIYWLFSSSFG